MKVEKDFKLPDPLKQYKIVQDIGLLIKGEFEFNNGDKYTGMMF